MHCGMVHHSVPHSVPHIVHHVVRHIVHHTVHHAVQEGRGHPTGDLPARDQLLEPAAAYQLVHSPLADATVGGRLRLCATQGPSGSGPPSATEQAEVLRVLTGRL